MKKHTKDKWTVPLYTRRDGHNRCWVMQGKTSICRTFGKPKIAEANAHLIASAPTLKQQRDDLLAAGKNARELLSDVIIPMGAKKQGTPIYNAIKELEAAIAKCET